MGEATDKRPRGASVGRSPSAGRSPSVGVAHDAEVAVAGGTTRPTGAAVNEVSLCGRLAAEAQERELPSGDLIVTLRIVVPRKDGPARPRSTGGARRRATVDTIDIVCWSARTRRAAMRLNPDDQVAVDGALRRRFYGGSAGPQSRYEVEAARVRRATPRASGDRVRGTPRRT